jgi:hypothetical protein
MLVGIFWFEHAFPSLKRIDSCPRLGSSHCQSFCTHHFQCLNNANHFASIIFNADRIPIILQASFSMPEECLTFCNHHFQYLNNTKHFARIIFNTGRMPIILQSSF